MSSQPSSQGSALDENELNELQISVQVESTKRQTSWGVKSFHEWCDKRGVNVHLPTVSSEELANILRRFYAEVKTKKGKALGVSSLTCLRAAIHRYLTQPPLNRNINIVADPEFVVANRMFETKQKLYRKAHNKKPQHKAVIEEGDMRKLRDYFRVNVHHPTVNQQFVWFSICYYMGRRGREGWRALSKQSFEVLMDDQNKKYLAMSVTEATKNHQDATPDDEDYSDDRIYEQGEQGVLCPVAAFEKHLQLLNGNCSDLFQKPSLSPKAKVAFTCLPLGKNAIADFMPKLSKAANLSRRYTNHCVRATTVTNLHRGGVPANRIIAVTKHKDEKSLAHYLEEPSAAEKRNHAAILSGAFAGSSSTSISKVVHHEQEFNENFSSPYNIVNYGTINITHNN